MTMALAYDLTAAELIGKISSGRVRDALVLLDHRQLLLSDHDKELLFSVIEEHLSQRKPALDMVELIQRLHELGAFTLFTIDQREWPFEECKTSFFTRELRLEPVTERHRDLMLIALNNGECFTISSPHVAYTEVGMNDFHSVQGLQVMGSQQLLEATSTGYLLQDARVKVVIDLVDEFECDWDGGAGPHDLYDIEFVVGQPPKLMTTFNPTRWL